MTTSIVCPITRKMAEALADAIIADENQYGQAAAAEALCAAVAEGQEFADDIAEGSFDLWVHSQLRFDDLSILLDACCECWDASIYFEQGDTLEARRTAARAFILGTEEL